jgi:hypothetical protein
MLNIHTHQSSQGKFTTRLWWIRHPLWRLMTQGTNEPFIVDVLQFYGFGMTITTLGKNNWCFQHVEVNPCSWVQFWQSFISPLPMNFKNYIVISYCGLAMCIKKATKRGCTILHKKPQKVVKSNIDCFKGLLLP